MALKQSPAMNLWVTQSEEWTHWMLFNGTDVVGAVVFVIVIVNGDSGARGEAAAMSVWSRRVRAMIMKKRESVAEAILSCISSGARGFEFGMACGPVHLFGDVGLPGVWGD